MRLRRAGQLVSTIVFAGAISSQAIAGTVTCASSCFIANLNAGDSIGLQVTLNTSDPNENGEGEPLVITGANYTIPNYAQPTPLPVFTATGPTAISAYIVGYEGDENATINFTVNPATGPKIFSDSVKAAATQVSAATNTIAAATALLAALQAAGVVTAGSALATAIVSGGAWTISALANQIAIDPIDPNYKVIATPTPAAIDVSKFSPATASLITTEEQVIGLLNAILTSANRVSGAAEAGDLYWQQQQQNAVATYSAQLSIPLQQLITKFANFGIDLKSLGVDLSALKSYDVYNFESQVAANGLDANMLLGLSELGVDSTTTDMIRNLAFVQDINLVAGDVNAGFTDAAFSASVNSLSQQLASTNVPEPGSLMLLMGGFLAFVSTAKDKAKRMLKKREDAPSMKFV